MLNTEAQVVVQHVQVDILTVAIIVLFLIYIHSILKFVIIGIVGAVVYIFLKNKGILKKSEKIHKKIYCFFRDFD